MSEFPPVFGSMACTHSEHSVYSVYSVYSVCSVYNVYNVYCVPYVSRVLCGSTVPIDKPRLAGGTVQDSTVRTQDRTGQDRTGQDRTGQDRTGQDRTGQDRTGQDRTGQEQDRTGQDRTVQRSAVPYRTVPDRYQYSTVPYSTVSTDSPVQFRTPRWLYLSLSNAGIQNPISLSLRPVFLLQQEWTDVPPSTAPYEGRRRTDDYSTCSYRRRADPRPHVVSAELPADPASPRLNRNRHRTTARTRYHRPRKESIAISASAWSRCRNTTQHNTIQSPTRRLVAGTKELNRCGAEKT